MLKIPDYPSDTRVIPTEINLKKQKWLVVAIYTPPSKWKSNFIIGLTKILDKYRGLYEGTVMLGGHETNKLNIENFFGR